MWQTRTPTQHSGDEVSLKQHSSGQAGFVQEKWLSLIYSPVITWPNQVFLGKFFPMDHFSHAPTKGLLG